MSRSELRLFDRPLSRDSFLRLWVGAIVIVVLAAMIRNVDVGGGYNPARASQFVGDLFGGAVVSFLLLAWFPALLRWVWRYGTSYPLGTPARRASGWRPGDTTQLRHRPVPVRGAGRTGGVRGGSAARMWRWQSAADEHERRVRAGADGAQPEDASSQRPLHEGRATWTNGSALRSDIGRPGAHHVRWLEDGPVSPAAASDDYRRAPDILLSTNSAATVPGVPVELTWRADGADYVTVEGVEQHLPPQGTLEIHVDSTRDLIVQAHNRFGTSSARSEVIRVLPVPVLHAVRFPAMGTVSVNADVRVGVDWDDPIMKRVDSVLTRHEVLRTERFPSPEPPAVPPVVMGALGALHRAVESSRGWRPGGVARLVHVLPEEGVGSSQLLRRVRRWVASVLASARAAVLTAAALARSRRAPAQEALSKHENPTEGWPHR